MTDCCDICGCPREKLTFATVLDSSGGSGVELCSECISAVRQNDELLDDGVCVCCIQRRNPSRSEGVHFQTSKAALHLCDDCRKAIVFDNTRTLGPVPRVGGDGR